jgi:hypothetical protein
VHTQRRGVRVESFLCGGYRQTVSISRLKCENQAHTRHRRTKRCKRGELVVPALCGRGVVGCLPSRSVE